MLVVVSELGDVEYVEESFDVNEVTQRASGVGLNIKLAIFVNSGRIFRLSQNLSSI